MTTFWDQSHEAFFTLRLSPIHDTASSFEVVLKATVLIMSIMSHYYRERTIEVLPSLARIMYCDTICDHCSLDDGPGNTACLAYAPRIQTGMCYTSWEFNLLVSFICLLLWCFVLIILSSLASFMQDHEQILDFKRKRKERVDFVRRMIKIKVSKSINVSE
jgi:hypothetical protein